MMSFGLEPIPELPEAEEGLEDLKIEETQAKMTTPGPATIHEVRGNHESTCSATRICDTNLFTQSVWIYQHKVPHHVLTRKVPVLPGTPLHHLPHQTDVPNPGVFTWVHYRKAQE